MIHSMSGGVIKDNILLNFAKVQLDSGEIFWYITNIEDLAENDLVIVPIGKTERPVRAKVLRIDKNVSIQTAPVPVNRAKQIICKI